MSRSAKKVPSAAKIEEGSKLTQPKVTIVIPTFNSERTVDLCLHSVKNQLYPNIETIIVDNYSRDKTLQAIKRFNVRTLMRGPLPVRCRIEALQPGQGAPRHGEAAPRFRVKFVSSVRVMLLGCFT